MSDNTETTGKTPAPRGVVVEFDFTAVDGAQILFDAAKKVLAADGIALTPKLEALHLAGGNYQGGLAELYRAVNVQGDAAKAARELADAFAAGVAAKAAAAVTPGFKAFVKALTDKGVKVVVATRADLDAVRPAFEGLGVTLHAETSMTYGNGKWDAWTRALNANGLINLLTVGVTGSGHGVKAVLVAGMSALAVVHPHVAYQDFGGADDAVDTIDAALAAEALRMLHL